MKFDVRIVYNRIILEPVDETSPLEALYGRFPQDNMLATLEADRQDELTPKP